MIMETKKSMGNVLRADTNEKDYITSSQVMELLNVSRATLSRWAKEGKALGIDIKWYRYKGTLYFCQDDVMELMKYY